jgi:hypothetical protein
MLESTSNKVSYLESLFKKYGGLENSEAQFFLLIHYYNSGRLTEAELFNLLRNSWKDNGGDLMKGQIGFWYPENERIHRVDFGRLTSGKLYLNYPFCEDAVTVTMTLRKSHLSLIRKRITSNTNGTQLFHNCGDRRNIDRDWNQWFLSALQNAQPADINKAPEDFFK